MSVCRCDRNLHHDRLHRRSRNRLPGGVPRHNNYGHCVKELLDDFALSRNIHVLLHRQPRGGFAGHGVKSMTMRAAGPRWKQERGETLVEFALSFALFLATVFGTM